MASQASQVERLAMTLLLALATLACNLQASLPGPSTAPDTVSVASSTATAASIDSTQTLAAATNTQAALFTPTATVGAPPLVKISAVGGRLNVRRGPGPEYDTVGAFLDGQATVATARNGDGTWLLINAPNLAKSLGWITLGTKYTSVTGDSSGLPVVEVGPAAPAYIRNCTGREMLVNPPGTILLPHASAPDNQLQFFPGEYTVIDMETEISVSNFTVFEGKTIDIKEDSSGKKSSC